MIFDNYNESMQHHLSRIQVGKHMICRSSVKAKCAICGTETHWRDADEMKPVCEKECLRQLHRAEEAVDHFVGEVEIQ